MRRRGGALLRKRKRLEATLEKQATNESLFVDLGLPVAGVETLMNRFNLPFRSEDLSWHYHFFASWSLSEAGRMPGAILEIGTESGAFAKFLGDIFPSKEVHTIDLPESSEKWISEYSLNDDHARSLYLENRATNLAGSNIHFMPLDSTLLFSHFSRSTPTGGHSPGLFDAIWVDGDHKNPQVTIDIVQSMALLKQGGFLLVDDVITDVNFREDKLVSNESWNTLRHLQSSGLVRVRLFNKRTRTTGLQKFIAHVQVNG